MIVLKEIPFWLVSNNNDSIIFIDCQVFIITDVKKQNTIDGLSKTLPNFFDSLLFFPHQPFPISLGVISATSLCLFSYLDESNDKICYCILYIGFSFTRGHLRIFRLFIKSSDVIIINIDNHNGQVKFSKWYGQDSSVHGEYRIHSGSGKRSHSKGCNINSLL